MNESHYGVFLVCVGGLFLALSTVFFIAGLALEAFFMPTAVGLAMIFVGSYKIEEQKSKEEKDQEKM